MITDAQLREIQQIIADHHAAFVASTVSPDAIDPETLERLKAKGLVNVKASSIDDAYLLGQVAAALENADIAKMGYDDFKEYVRDNPIPLSEVERRAMQVAAQSAGQYAVGLGYRVDLSTGQTIREADQSLARSMREQIEDATALNIAKRETVKQLRSDLGHRTRDWARDLDRIAITELHNAHQAGVADGLAKEHGDPLVFKRAMPDACEACKELHNGDDGHPMIWRLSALEANGTNVGKKRAQWLPVVGAVHPHCQCQLVRVPEGWGFNEEGQLVPKGEGGERYETTESFQERKARYEQLKKGLLAGHTVFQGLPIGVENPAGSVRTWRDVDGESGSTRMLYAYGFVEHTMGTDGDEIDVFVGPDPQADTAFVVHQQNPRTGLYDEDKVMLGFGDERTALLAYRAHYDRPDFEVTVSPISVEHFKRWVSDTRGGNEEGLTEPLEKNPEKLTKPRFVIPMAKALRTESGTVDATYAARNAPHGNRAPGPGLGANHLFNTPPRTPPQTLAERGHHMDPRGMVEEAQQRGEARKRDKRVYEYKEPLPSALKPWEVPEWYHKDRAVDPADAEYQKQMAIDFGTRNLQRPRNNVEVGDDASDE